MKTRHLILLAVATALTCSAFAQDGPPGGPPPGQGGPPPGFGPMGGGMEGPDRLVMRPDVQADLQLTDDQKSQLDALRQSMRPPGGPGGGPPPDGPPGGGQGGPGGTGGPGGAQFDAMRKKTAEQIAKILTPDQQARLKGISVQLSGNLAAADPGIQKDLNLTDDQKDSIKTLMRKQQEANRTVFERMRDGDIDRSEIPGIMKQNSEILKTEIGKILTDTQKSAMKAMAGKPFAATSRGFGGPGGGGR